MPRNIEKPFCNATTKKNILKSKHWPQTQDYSQCHISRSMRKRRMCKHTAGTQNDFPRKKYRNKLKRLHVEVDIPSGSTISIYEPGRKKKRIESHFPVNLRSDSPLKTIYKNPNFSTSLESMPNGISPLLRNWPFDTNLSWEYMPSNQHSFGSLSEWSSNKDFPENGKHVFTVTGPDGNDRQITVQKAVLMHVREAQAQTKLSFTNCKENMQRVSEETPHSLASESDFQHCEDRNFINHISSLKLMGVKSSRNCTNIRLQRSHSREVVQIKSSSEASIKEQGNHCWSAGDAVSQSTCHKLGDTTHQVKSNVLKQATIIGDHPDPDDNGTMEIETKIAEMSLEVVKPHTLLSNGQPSNCTLNDVERKESKNDLPCSVLLLVFVLLSTLLNIM